MKRVNYHLTGGQITRLKKVSEKSGLGVAEIIRRSVDYYLNRKKIIKIESVPSGYNEYPYKRITGGYWMLLNRDYSFYDYEHRYVMENKIGRTIRRTELVHHKDGDKLNNSLDNLELIQGTKRHKIHGKKHAEMEITPEKQ